MVFGVVVSMVEFATAPLDSELPLFNSILGPVEISVSMALDHLSLVRLLA
jgi:hypothetical protein